MRVDERLGATPDGGVDLTGAVALCHRYRVGLVVGRRRQPDTGRTEWVGIPLEDDGGSRRWTSVAPIVIAHNLREYAEATDDLLGLTELRRRRCAGSSGR